jgi:hypothetical protein
MPQVAQKTASIAVTSKEAQAKEDSLDDMLKALQGPGDKQ